MIFGQKLKEMRLKYAEMGLRKFSEVMGVKASELSDIEQGYAPPPDCGRFLAQVRVVLDISAEHEDWTELAKLRFEPFVMQKMEEEGRIFHATKRIQPGEEGYTSEEDDYNTRPATSKECVDISEWFNNRAREHNKKADEYNEKHKENNDR